MKKLTLTAMVALALVLTYTQCKKETEKPAATEEKVFVALTATANDGSASATERRPHGIRGDSQKACTVP